MQNLREIQHYAAQCVALAYPYKFFPMRARPKAVEAIVSGATLVHRLAIAWVNRNRKEYFTELCTSQNAWARDVWDAKPQGGRTKH